jgi:predicted nucleotidyltransferase
MYEKLKDKELEEFLKELVEKYEFISEEYFNNLKDLSVQEVIDTFKEDKEKLINEFKVKTLMIHGSYAKENVRIDSDIDILVKIDLDLPQQEINKKIKELKEYYTNKFKRFVDIQELKGGHINSTYLIVMPEAEYTLQQINTDVFISPFGMMHNIREVTEHIRKKVIDSLAPYLKDMLRFYDNKIYYNLKTIKITTKNAQGCFASVRSFHE